MRTGTYRMMLLATAALTGAAQAQETTAVTGQAEPGLSEIVVTAQRRTENLQRTPISISVLSNRDLDNRRVVSLLDLGNGAIPSLRVAPFFSRASALVINIRGIGVLADSNQPARDQGVGVYVDGVYLGRAQGLGVALFDVENIEVLKGPQGTLFGRNTQGGAVSIVTKKPSGEFRLNGTVGLGNFGSSRAEMHLDLPEFANISLKIDALAIRRGGFVDNPLPSELDFNSYDRRGIKASAMWRPGDSFDLLYSYDNSWDSTSSAYFQALTAGSLARAPILPLQPARARTASLGVPQEPSIGKVWGHSLVAEWRVADNLTLKSINALRKLNQSQFDNGSTSQSVFVPNGTFSRDSLAFFDQRQVSTEFQAVGEFPRLKYAVGALYYTERVEDSAQAFNTMQFNATGTAANVLTVNRLAQRIDRASRVTTDSVGVFGQATWTPALLDDRLALTLGARWTRDEKNGELFIVNGGPPNVDGVIGPRRLDASWSRVDPLVTLAFQATDDVALYGKWSTGYRSGGANSRSLRYAAFNPETVSMFEIGAKTEFWDRRARLNVAAYTGNYNDVQLDFFANFIQRDANGNLVQTNRTTSETTNAPGRGRLAGVEVDATVTPLDGLILSASYAYNYVRIPDTANPFPQGATGIIVPTPIPIYPVYTPRNAASGAIDYTLPLKGLSLLFHLDANYADGFFANFNDPVQPVRNAAGVIVTPGVPQPKGEGAINFNTRLGITDVELPGTGARLALTFWARNLFNEQHVFYKSFGPLTGTAGFFSEPRTWGLEVNVRY